MTGFQTLASNMIWPENVQIISDLSETISFIQNNLNLAKVD